MTGSVQRVPGPRPSRLVGVVVLGGVLAAATALALAVGHGRPRWTEAVAFAAAVAGGGNLAGWLFARRAAASPASAIGGALAATILRILPPLAGLAWLGAGGQDLRRAGADGLLVGFYLALLATAVFLDIIAGRTGASARGSAEPAGREPPTGV